MLTKEPVRAAGVALIAIVGFLQIVGVIDVDTAANIAGAIAILTGAELTRSRVTPA